MTLPSKPTAPSWWPWALVGAVMLSVCVALGRVLGHADMTDSNMANTVFMVVLAAFIAAIGICLVIHDRGHEGQSLRSHAHGAWHGTVTMAKLLWAALQRYLNADGMRQGAAISFYAAFSIAPLLVVVTAVMVWLLGNDGAQAALLDAMTRLIGERETRTLSELLANRTVASAIGTQPLFGSWLALATTLIGATGVFVELRSAVQAMVGERDGDFSWRRLLQIRLTAIGVVLSCGFLLSIAMLAQTAALVALRWLTSTWAWLAPVLLLVEGVWSWGVITLLFALMIGFLPSTRLPKRHALIGAAVAAALFMVGRYGISLYIATTATQSALGAAGSFAALLVWVYWSSQIFLLGAALAVELGSARAPTALPT